ncbi:MAG TPA: DUF4197 domain-containing protein [Chitinophagaceae bacterium]|jgi:hypothetical protein|nr:DUF4197 domain-containing protein [Chitinophagaceae bacterium]
MKKWILLLMLGASVHQASAQGFKKILKSATSKDTAAGRSASGVLKSMTGKGSSLSQEEIAGGLREALEVGAGRAGSRLSAADGYFKDAALKILMPEEAKKAEQTLRRAGMGRQVDNAILSMNRAAEDAAKSAAPIFVQAIKEMTITDALGILRGGDYAATDFLKGKTLAALTNAFRPSIEAALQKTDATKHWNSVFTAYNQFSREKVNTDLTAYVTERALAGLFLQLGQEELKIRKDPVARSSDLLKKVFAN